MRSHEKAFSPFQIALVSVWGTLQRLRSPGHAHLAADISTFDYKTLLHRTRKNLQLKQNLSLPADHNSIEMNHLRGTASSDRRRFNFAFMIVTQDVSDLTQSRLRTHRHPNSD